MLHLTKEGIQQAKEALQIYERLNDVWGQARSLCRLALFVAMMGSSDAAEGDCIQVIDRFLGKGEQFEVCECYRLLSEICRSKGETEKAIDHLKAALEIASSFNWHFQLLWIHYSLADLSFDKGRFDDAHAHIELAKSHAVQRRIPSGSSGGAAGLVLV
jgi:tetratricopeptide (TPR) repeat protein